VRRALGGAALSGAVALGALAPAAYAARVERVSVSSAGAEGSGLSDGVAISADGRYVAFSSNAADLVPGDTNGTRDVFVHDRQSGETRRVSVSSTGAQANGDSDSVAISADGRYIGFSSDASNLVASDTNKAGDVFVYDRVSGGTELVSVSSAGAQADDSSFSPTMSADGRYVSFVSYAPNLVAGDTNGRYHGYDVFVHDRVSGETQRVSVSSSGAEANDSSFPAGISGDGRYVLFATNATNLVAGDTNNSSDVFVRDRQSGETKRVSVSSSGAQAAGYSSDSAISADGRYVAFTSSARNLVADDTNLSAPSSYATSAAVRRSA
jgi:predicted RNA-binding protein with TRAM domain